jgi:hypothetical protein
MSNDKKVDGPDGVAFAKAFVQSMTSKEDSAKLANGLMGAYFLGKAIRYVDKKR